MAKTLFPICHRQLLSPCRKCIPVLKWILTLEQHISVKQRMACLYAWLSLLLFWARCRFCNRSRRHQPTCPKSLFLCSCSPSLCSIHPLSCSRSSAICLEISKNKHEILISPAMAYLAFYILFWEIF